MPNLLSSRRTSPVGLLERMTTERFTRSAAGRRPQFRDQPQDVGEQISWNGDLGHLEGDIAAVADDVDGLSSTAS